MDSSAKVKGQQPCLEGQYLIQEGKNKPVWWAELHTLYSAVMEDLNRTRVPLSGFLDSVAWPHNQANGSGKLAYETGAHVGHSPVEITMGIRGGALEQHRPMPI